MQKKCYATFRNPKEVEYIRTQSIFLKIANLKHEEEAVAFFGEQMQERLINGYKPIPIVNKTKKGFVTIKSLVSNCSIDNGINSMVILLHPKLIIALIPDEHYNKMVSKQGNQTYMVIKDEKEIQCLNGQLYHTAKNNNEDVIGIKEDLEELKKSLNNK